MVATIHQIAAVSAAVVVVAYACLAAGNTSKSRWEGQLGRLAALSIAFTLVAMGAMAYAVSTFDPEVFGAETACFSMATGAALYLTANRRRCISNGPQAWPPVRRTGVDERDRGGSGHNISGGAAL